MGTAISSSLISPRGENQNLLADMNDSSVHKMSTTKKQQPSVRRQQMQYMKNYDDISFEVEQEAHLAEVSSPLQKMNKRKSPTNSSSSSSSSNSSIIQKLRLKRPHAEPHTSSHSYELTSSNSSLSSDSQTEDFLAILQRRSMYRSITKKTDPLFSHFMQRQINIKMGKASEEVQLGSGECDSYVMEEFSRIQACHRFRSALIQS